MYLVPAKFIPLYLQSMGVLLWLSSVYWVIKHNIPMWESFGHRYMYGRFYFDNEHRKLKLSKHTKYYPSKGEGETATLT